MAYISLSVAQKDLSHEDDSYDDSEDQFVRGFVSVETALESSARILIRGLAGSGKTTLLQWIAVRAATNSFEGQLAHWNGRVPFYIRLRRYAQSRLPRPEEFPDFAAPAIVGAMPQQWVHNILRSGRALVLVDGIDEVSAMQRQEMYIWLRDLIETYSKSCFIVTSRPHAIEEGWMNHEAFGDAMLQDMQLADIYSFIDHWHEAVRQELQMDDEKNELIPLAEHLKEQVIQNRPIRTLATNPLLCAMLCALNRERRQQLPVNRIELYQACCSLLLERREKESRIDLSDYPSLNYGQKQRLLEDLAYWMIQEDLSVVDTTTSDERFTYKLANMPNIPAETTGKTVRRLLVERAAMLRELTAGQIDFTHRTFQEFFAAQAAASSMDIEQLVINSHKDQWHEVIILAAGLISKDRCEQLLRGLIERGDKEKERRYQTHLIAVSCLETAIELGPEIRAEVEKRLGQLIPPKTMADAKALAAAGELSIRYLDKKRLMRKGKLTAVTCAACVRALALIGSDTALAILEGYAKDMRATVVNELLEAWDRFDRETYARRILSQALRNKTELRPERISSLDGIQYFTSLTYLDLSYNGLINDLTPLSTLINLCELYLSNCRLVSDLRPLAGLTNLSTLDLFGCSQVTELTALAGLINLHELNLNSCNQISDLSPLAGLINLNELNLFNCHQVRNLTPLSGLLSLVRLNLSSCDQVTDLSPLASLTNLRELSLYDCHQVRNLAPLAELTKLHISR